jgi:hypothetical protein
LYLLRGTPEEDTLFDLAHPPLREDTERALEPLTLQLSGSELHAVPGAALRPGGLYRLVWARATDPQVFAFWVSRSPAAGAALVESWPPPGAANVPGSLDRALLHFDGYLANPGSAQLVGPVEAKPVTVRSQPCEELGFPVGDCVWLSWQAPLPTGSHRLTLEHAQAQAGAAIETITLPFVVDGKFEPHAPRPTPLACALDEHAVGQVCVLASDHRLSVRFQASEPAFTELLAPPGRAAAIGLSDPLMLELADLDAQRTPRCFFLRLTDLAQQQTTTSLCLDLPSDLPSVSIDEVLVDPGSASSAQEFVELLNFGAKAVDMDGFSLSDDAFAAGQALPDGMRLMPGERALLVGPDFERDRSEGADAGLSGALRLIRLSHALGLANAGVSLFLRDASMRRLSATPRSAPERAGQCLARLPSADPRSAAGQDFALDPSGGCSPGRATNFALPLGPP